MAQTLARAGGAMREKGLRGPLRAAKEEGYVYDRNRNSLFDSLEEGGIRPSSSYSTSEIAEQENDRGIDGLSDRVNVLKRLTTDIHDEVDNHNRLLERMDQDMETSRGMLSGTMDRFTRVFETKGGRNMLTIVGSLVIVFLLIYYLTK